MLKNNVLTGMVGSHIKGIVLALVGVIISLSPQGMLGQAPPNDFFTNRVGISGFAWSISGNNTNSSGTRESGEPSGYAGTIINTLWYEWTAPTNGLFRMDTFGSSFNTILGVFTNATYSGGSINNEVLIAGNDNSGGTLQSRVTFNAVSGAVYQIQLGSYRYGTTAQRATNVGPFLLNGNFLPVSWLTTPAEGTKLAAPANLTMSAVVQWYTGTVSRVDFYLATDTSTNLAGTLTSPPYQLTVSNVTAGRYRLYTRVEDSRGDATFSPVVNVEVVLPGATITQPSMGQFFGITSNIVVSADAFSMNTITLLQFFDGTNLIGQATGAPATINWNTFTPGGHDLRVVARDSANNSYTSAVVTVYVKAFDYLIRAGSIWKYHNLGQDLGGAWNQPGFDDSAWPSGPTELGFGDGDEATVIDGGPSSARFPTIYFRRAFAATNVSMITNLICRLKRDDGAVVWLNGQRLYMDNIAGDPVLYSTLATQAAPDDGANWNEVNIPPTALVEGTNVLAVEMHQSSATSSDMSFNFEMVAEYNAGVTTVFLTSPLTNSYFLEPAIIPLRATASHSLESPLTVSFYQNGAKIADGVQEAGNWVWTLTNAPVGQHAFYAVAKDRMGFSATSVVANVNVYARWPHWTAFNDHAPGSGTGPNVTTYNVFGVNTGSLTNVYTGEKLTATMTATANAGVEPAGTMGTPSPGTPAYNLFNGYVDFQGSPNAAILVRGSLGGQVVNRFAGLSPSALYSFRGTSVRGNSSYTNRWTLVRLTGARSFRPAHTAGVLTQAQVPSLALNEAIYNSGFNTAGDVVGWDDIVPATNGEFSVICEQFTGTLPNGFPADGPYGYSINAFRLEEAGPPLAVTMTAPANNSIYQGPTNLTLSASATASLAVAKVQFFADSVLLGEDPTSPYSMVWTNATWATNRLTAVAYDVSGGRATSAVVVVTVNAPPENLDDPVVLLGLVNPAPGSRVTNLTSINVRFSEPVTGVNAADLLVNGVPATAVGGSGSNYTFTIAQPAVGTAQITWAVNHGIQDLGYPPRAFDATAPGATWSYIIADGVPPGVIGQVPAANSTVTNLTSVVVTFSEPVVGVDASDFLVNGVPAYGVSGSGNVYTFTFGQPWYGTVAISWALSHGITDVSDNPMNASASTNRWSYTMRGQPVVLVASNAVYRWLRGTNEASIPTNAWRTVGFNDSSWGLAPGPFFYDTAAPFYTGNTELTDMQGNYATIYLRQAFVISNPLAVTNMVLYHKVDDGFVAWLNGVEVARYNVPDGELAYNSLALGGVGTTTEYTAVNVTNWSALVAGTNVLAIHALNSALATSSDFLLDVYLAAEALDPGLLAPRIAQITPAPGWTYALTNITVTFSRPVTGVDAADLLLNGVPAVSVSGTGDTYTFVVAQPAYGLVNVTWANNHGIVDLNNTAFNASAPEASWSYRLVNPNAPVIVNRTPTPESLVVTLTNATVTFSRNVTGVDAADFRVNGLPATGVSGTGSNYVFSFTRPAYGQVQFTWATNANITAVGSPQDVFDSTDPLANWSVTFVFQEPPVIVQVTPPPSALTNLTEVVVEFSETVTGVDASDLLINGQPATGLEGDGVRFRFTFAQPPVGTANFTWATGHGIRDLGVPSLAFDATAPGATWSYNILDGVPPVLISRRPAPGEETPVATTLAVQFSEPVVGVDAADLLVDLQPAASLTVLASNIYVFTLPSLSYGYHSIIWALTNGITDIKGNPFNRAAHSWSFIYYNSNAPVIVERIPPAGGITNELTNVWVRFDRPVSGVDASDLLVNYEPAASVVPISGGYLFSFAQPPYGTVSFTWDLSANIADASQPGNLLETFRPSANWQIALEYQAPPEIASVIPAPGSSVGTLSEVTVVFSEAVTNVDAGDLLINGVAATNVVGGGSNYVFRFTQPGLGTVNFSWAPNHQIRDLGIPSKPFDHTAPGATWSYTVVEITPPVVVSQSPAAGAAISNLFFIQVTFSEPVVNVDAADLLVNGVPAFSLSGSNSSYTFYISTPAYGTVNISWAANHGITDLAGNPFDRNGVGATWSYLLQPPRVTLIASNSVWSYRLGTNEVSNPIEAWRLASYNASSWPTGATFFYYGDPLSGTLIPAMSQNAYSSLFMRKTFVVEDPAFVTNVLLRVAVDDGFVAWINGVEVARFNMGSAGNPVFYNSFATANAQEVPGGGPGFLDYPLNNPLPSSYLVRGTNVLAIHGFNVNATSSDFALNAELSAEISGTPANLPPMIIAAVPASGDVYALSNLVITFSKPVTGVDASDLLVNGVPATGVSGSNNIYTFTFPQPPYGSVLVNWAAGNGIRDLSNPPLYFDGSASSARFIYNLLNPNAPVVVNKSPDGSQIVTQLTSVTITFSKAVTGVDAADFLVNGNSATGVSGSGSIYTFIFPQPAYGIVQFGWSQNHGITDLDNPPNAFDQRRPGASWQVQLVDRTAPVVARVQPPAGSVVTNLTEVTVTFSENVTGVEARDLFINGTAALAVNGTGSNYVFTFAPVNASIIRFTWASTHGIADTASPPNLFDGTAPAAQWQYYTVDTTPPTVAAISPIPGSVVVDLREIRVMFSEPVQDLDATDLLVNGLPANSVVGVGAGPYVFNVPTPMTGTVQVTWASGHQIRDLASPPNAFTGSSWTYTYEPGANYAGKVVISEIMYNPASLREEEEWLEIRNLTPTPINLTGWRINRGVDYTFPAMTLPPYGYWVVARDTNRFRALYPSVTNVVGNWTGQLSNNGEDVELETPWGDRVDLIPYASEGDWAIRRRGSVTYYNGHRGWEWYTPADGLGATLELVNTNLPSRYGQNWRAATTSGGTPGRANSVAEQNSAPLIIGVEHAPAIPRSTDPVRISALILDEQTNGLTVTLYWRDASSTTPGNFTAVTMRDNGQNGDLVPGDRVYSAQVPAQPNLTIVEFYVEALDASNNTRTWPGPAYELDGSSMGQVANALYQVDNDSTIYPQPQYRLIMSGAERQEIQNIWQVDSAGNRINAEMNTTFIASDASGVAVRYLCGVRNRGNSSRCSTCNPGNMQNYRVNIPTDNLWRGQRAFNLNCKYAHSQYMGNIMFRKAGLPVEDGNMVRLKLNGVDLINLIGSAIGGPGNNQPFPYYIHLEELNSDWAENHYPDNAGGNLYRCMRTADLTYRGTNYLSYTTGGYNYSKASNQRVNDWSDLFNMLWVINNTPEAQWAAAARQVINVDQWVRYYAVMNLIGFGETSIGSDGDPDDFTIYLGPVDRRAVIMPHDGDTNFGEGDGSRQQPTISIWRAVEDPGALAFNTRFLRNPEIAPLYLGALYEYATTIFSTNEIFATYDQALGPLNIGTTVARMKAWSAQRVASVLSQINLNLTVTNLDSFVFNNGVYVASTPNINLRGRGNVIHTRQVRVQGSPATWTAWSGQWNANITLNPGYNLVRIETVNSNNVVFASTNLVFFYDRGDTIPVSGTISTDTTWLAGSGPYNVTGTLTVASGATLTIQAGTTVYLGSGVNLVVANGGRLLAEGTATAPIRFTRAPGASTTWGGLTINGSANSPESRLSHVIFEYNNSTAITVTDGTVWLDNLRFGNTGRQYLELTRASFVVQNCEFPSPTGSFEPTHGTGGIKAGGRGIFRRNFWGKVSGYNDALDFTGGQRPGPVLVMLNNVFMGSDDDLLDLDGTDAWVEGNIFVRARRAGTTPDSGSAISGGQDGGRTSKITAVNNVFYDLDHVANAKEGNFYVMRDNTVVWQNGVGSLDAETALLVLADEGTAQGAGVYMEGNVVHTAERLARGVTTAVVTYTNNVLWNVASGAWGGPGGGNVVGDPQLGRVPVAGETGFTNWAGAQAMWEWVRPAVGSVARGKGATGRWGVRVKGAPEGVTPERGAVLTVGFNVTGNGMPVGAYPAGAGWTHYRWRLDGGSWSAETPVGTPLVLSGLPDGPHEVEVVGKSDAGWWQDDPVFGEDATVTRVSWVVDGRASTVRLSEVLAANRNTTNHFGTTPDVVELYNASDVEVSLAGVRLTDDPANPDKFIFPANAVLGPRAYLVLFANEPDGTPGYHLGFNLSQNGEGVYLYQAAEDGGQLLDSVEFGIQLTDYSIARFEDGQWRLAQPTLGAPNISVRTGDVFGLRLNEWLALARSPFESDFVEIFNPQPQPVALGGLYVSDEMVSWRNRHAIRPLSFIAGGGYTVMVADGNESAGADHLSFRLEDTHGGIGLYATDLTPIDIVVYDRQNANVSMGRSPNGSTNVVFFTLPTPGAPNPTVGAAAPFGGALVVNEVLAQNTLTVVDGRTPDWVELYNGSTNSVDLGDCSLTDNPADPRRYVFAAGTVVPAGGYYRIYCDGGLPASTNNTGFGLNAVGGGVYLYDKPGNGGGLISGVTYGWQAANLSIGRVPSGSTNWVLCLPTPLAANMAVMALGDPALVRINEWMANPQNGDDWFELYNPNFQPVALSGYYLTDNLGNPLKHPIPPLSFLGSGTNGYLRLVADGNVAAGADHVNFSLRGAGEALGLFTPSGIAVDTVEFGAQDEGVSEGRLPDGAAVITRFPGTATPGEANYALMSHVVINEALTHTDPPLEDAIEIRNVGTQAVDLAGWWLSDDPSFPQKYQIPGPAVVQPGGFFVVYEQQFTNRDLAALPFALSSHGDEIVLAETVNGQLSGYRAQVKFGAAATGVSFGRYVNSVGDAHFVAMSARTFGVDDPGTVEQFRQGQGAPNAAPLVGPVVITEIMYHPPDLGTNDNVLHEYIELQNTGTTPVALHDPAHPTNTWRLRDAVDFEFPAGATMMPGETWVVVSFDPQADPEALASFRSRYQIPSGATILGPYRGKLANNNDAIELERPDTPDTNGVPYILVERIRYADQAPWPVEADGAGYALHRVDARAYGNDPINWRADIPNPGPAAAPLDVDNDGIPNAWELAYGLDPFSAVDAAVDSDGDGMSNFQEYLAGTHPFDPASTLKLKLAPASGAPGTLRLDFQAAPDRGYRLERATRLVPGDWQVWTNWSAAPTNRQISLPLAPAGGQLYFRIRTE